MRTGPLSIALSLCTAVSSAQVDPAATPLLEGSALRSARNELAALAAFERAYALCHCEEAMAQRAFAEQALGRWEDAAEHLDAVPLSSNDPWVARHREAIAAARTHIEEHVGWLELRVTPPHARARVAGRDRADARRIRVARGEVAVRVEAAGYVAETRIVRVARHGATRIEVSLLPEAPPPPAPHVVMGGVSRAMEAPREAARPRYRRWVWATGITAGLSLIGAGVALWARGEVAARYSDPSCVTVFASRDERCGAYGDAVVVNEALAATGFAVAGLAGVAAAVLAVIDARPRSERAFGCSMRDAGLVGCGLRF